MPPFRVRFVYREPTFEQHAGLSPRAWPVEYEVRGAQDREEAVRLAVEEFRRIERLSSVGWAREIVSVGVESVTWALGDEAVIQVAGDKRWGRTVEGPSGPHRVWLVELPDGSRFEVPQALLERPEPS